MTSNKSFILKSSFDPVISNLNSGLRIKESSVILKALVIKFSFTLRVLSSVRPCILRVSEISTLFNLVDFLTSRLLINSSPEIKDAK